MLATTRENPWAALGALLLLWVVCGFFLFLLLAFTTQAFTVALIGGVLAGLVAAIGLGWKLEMIGPVQASMEDSPLWVRLLLPLLPLVLFGLLLVVALGALLSDFVLLMVATVVGDVILTGLLVWALGLWGDVPDRVRTMNPTERLVALTLMGVVTGLAGFLVGLVVLGEVWIGLAILLPAMLLGAVVPAFLTGWHEEATAAVRAPHWGIRLGVFLVLFLLLTFYFSLLVGPLFTIALAGYAVSAAMALLLLVPTSMWALTWRDLWASFTDLGEENRLLAVLPIFPLGAGLIFLAIVVFTSMFELAYVVSLPAGLLLFLLVGLPFGITQDIPRVVRDQGLPVRALIFTLTFLALTAYAYFGVALFLQLLEVSLLIGMALAALVLGGLIYAFDLGEGLAEEFESYGAPAEAGVLAAIFVLTLALSFLLIALALDDFRIAFLVSVLVAAGVNYLVAHTTELIDGMRQAIGEMPWWGDLLFLAGVFALAFAYGTIALGVFYANPSVAFAFGAILALGAVVAISRDLEVGEDMLATADEKRNARVVLMTLSFLGGFLVGLYLSAALLQVAGVDLFGFPFFIALLTGTGSLLLVAKTQGWGTTAISRMRTAKDRAKVAGVLAAWLFLGVLTGFAIQSIPISASTLGLGDDPFLPLGLTLAFGLLLWAWLPVLLFRVARVERTPVQATVTMGEKPKLLASLGWGVLAFLVTLVIMLSAVDDPVLGFSVAIAVGYLIALGAALLRTRSMGEIEEPDA